MNHFNLRKSTSIFLVSALHVSALPVSVSAMEANTDKAAVLSGRMLSDRKTGNFLFSIRRL